MEEQDTSLSQMQEQQHNITPPTKISNRSKKPFNRWIKNEEVGIKLTHRLSL